MSWKSPPPNPFYKFETVGFVPDAIEAKEELRVPYRITKLADLLGDDGGAGEGEEDACRTIELCNNIRSISECINGAVVRKKEKFCTYKQKCGPGTPLFPFDAFFNHGGNSKSGGSKNNDKNKSKGYSNTNGWGKTDDSGLWAIGKFLDLLPEIPLKILTETQPIEGLRCAPRPLDPSSRLPPGSGPGGGPGGGPGPGGCPDDDACCKNKSRAPAASHVNLAIGDFEDEELDLTVRVLGHTVPIARTYFNNQWHFDLQRQNLSFSYEISGTTTQIASLTASGAGYAPIDEDRTAFAYGDRRIIVESNGYRRIDVSGDYKFFDPSGQLAEIGDRNDCKVFLGYDTNGNLTSYSDNFSNQVIWITWESNRITRAADAAAGAREVIYTYDDQGLLNNVTGITGAVTEYGYDASGRLNFKRQPSGKESTIEYDSSSYVISILDQDGVGKFFDYGFDVLKGEYYAFVQTTDGDVFEQWYDRFGRKIRADVNGEPTQRLDDGTQVETDERGNVTRIVYPDGTTATKSYDPILNVLVAETDVLGVMRMYQHDDRGNLTNEIHGVGLPEERRIVRVYDAFGRMTQMTKVGDTNVADAVTALTYDNQGNVLTVTMPGGSLTSNVYNDAGFRICSIDAVGNIWSTRVNEVGLPLEIFGPDGFTASNTYDAAGNLVAVTDPTGRTTQYERDTQGRLTKTIDPFGNETVVEYDFAGRVVRRSDGNVLESGRDYDASGRLVKTWVVPGFFTSYEYDGLGRASRVTTPDGDVWDVVYDADGNKIRLDGPGITKLSQYDAGGRVTQVDELSDLVTLSATFTYDVAGRMVAVSNSSGESSAKTYDVFNQVRQVVTSGCQTNSSSFDAHGNVISLTDGNGNTTRAEYDPRGLPTKKIYPDGSFNQIAYDALGRPQTLIDAIDRKLTYAYNGRGGVTGISHFAQSSDLFPTSVMAFAFDVLGRQTNWSYGDFSEQTTYDDVQRIVTRTIDYGAFSKTDALHYDELARPTRFEGPDGGIIEYTYDERRRLQAMDIEGEGSVLFGAYSADRATEITLPGGTVIETTLGTFTVLSNRVIDPASNLIYDAEYLAAGSDKLRVLNTLTGTARYEYNKLGFLTNAQSTALGDETYTYDAVGNRLSGPTGGVVYLYNELNQLTNSIRPAE